MKSINAVELGYNYQQVMAFYEAEAKRFYDSMVSAASSEHTSLYSTARGLAGNKYTKPASDQVFSQARVSETQANLKIASLKLEYQSKVETIKTEWNNSKIVFATISGTSHYYQLPFHAGLNINNTAVSINFMGKNYPIQEVTYDEACDVQDRNLWETLNCNFSDGITIGDNISIGNNVTMHSGNTYYADNDGDVVMGETIIGDKVMGNKFNINW